MPSTVHKSTRAAVFVIISLLLAVIAGTVLYLLYADTEPGGIVLLGGCALVAFGFAVLAIRIFLLHRRSVQLEQHGVKPNMVLRSLELGQWMQLTVGIAFLAIATGAATALRVLPAGAVEAAAPVPTPPPAVATTEPVATTDPTPTETIDPTLTTDPTEEPPTSDPTETPVDTPATKYLDEEDALEGGFNRGAVTFDAERFTRGVQFTCRSARDSTVQWNVAGYRTFTTVTGVDDATSNAFGETVEFIFYDEDGRELLKNPVDVSVGHPQKVKLDLTGVVNLRIVCSSRNTKTNEQTTTLSALGDPAVSR